MRPLPTVSTREDSVDLLTEALAWHALGYAPLPVAVDGSKRPGLPRWREFIEEPPTEAEVRGFWAHVDTDGLGLLCGAASGQLEMLEVEGRAAHLAGELAQLLDDNGFGDLWTRIDGGYVEQTPSGGIHWHYRVDGPAQRNTKLARDGDRQVLLETRGEGGFTVVAPSAGRTHSSGDAWTVLRGTRDTIPTITVDERDALHAIATMLDRMPPEGDIPRSATTADVTSGRLRPGDDYNARTDWEQLLGPRGWVRSRRLGRGYGWTRPGKDPRLGISATTGTSGDGEDRLFVFSSSTEFEPERPYSKFAAYTLLEHAGDWSAAAAALASAGYGSPREPEPALTIADRPQPVERAGRPRLEVIQGGAATDGTAALAGRPATTLARSEDAHSQLLIEHYGDLIRYCSERGAWLAWDGIAWRWQRNGGVVREYAKAVGRMLPVGEGGATTHKKRSLSNAGITACLGLSETDERVAVSLTQLDADPWTLNTPAGLVDLRTGAVRPPDPAALCTRITTAAPDFASRNPDWERFLDDTFGGDGAISGYVQRLAGLTLIGAVREQLLAFLHGTGANGKSTLAEALMHALATGPHGYATAAPAEMLMIRRHEAHPAELAQLAGARMVVCSELDDGQRFAEARIKQLTGSDSINARFLYGQPFTFTPTHTLWLLGNQRPQARTGGEAFWRRVKLVDFPHVVPPEKRDPALGDRLKAASGVILAWAINGAVDYCKNGIREPDSVAKATRAYAEDQDTVGRFVAEMVHLCPANRAARVPVADVRAAYEKWCAEIGEMPVDAKRLTNQLGDRYGVETVKGTKGRRLYEGAVLLRFEDDEERPERWDER